MCLGEEDETSDKAVRGLLVAAKWYEESKYHCPDNVPQDAEIGREGGSPHLQQGAVSRADDTSGSIGPPRISAPSAGWSAGTPISVRCRAEPVPGPKEAKRWLDDLPPDAPPPVGPRP